MSEFLADNNVCGQSILLLVSRGNAIISEILRLKDYVPDLFRLSKQDGQKYADIILDFSYFKISEAQEQKIESNEVLRNLDEEFRDNHIDIISRFYFAFESIHTYIKELNCYIDELEDGYYIHQNMETVFADVEGKQLLCEALYLYGTILLLVDAHLEGVVRERLLVSFYRYTPQSNGTENSIDEICKLLRDTGINSKKITNYPEDYFKRIPIKESYVELVLGKLRSDDVYNQLTVYPLTRHRSTALANQAAMLYICLFFSPEILHTQNALMREIVDKYFPDNWVISIYMGFTVNLVENWDSFKAAKLALSNTVENANIKHHSDRNGRVVKELLNETTMLLKEGTVTRDNLLQNINKIVNVVRDCNVAIRWLMLHAICKQGKVEKNKKCKQLRDLVIADSKYEAVIVFKLLLNTSQLELLIKDIYKNLINEKEKRWEELKKESYEMLVELSEIFSGEKPLTRIQKNTNLKNWFLEISKQVDSLDPNLENASVKIDQLIQALEEVQEFHQLSSNMQIIQFLSDTKRCLNHMIRNMKVKEDVLITLQIIGDICYAWDLIDSYTPIMQLGIKREPTLVIKLRAVFLKLGSALEIPLLRINQAHSEDLISVSQYYSRELEIYIRMVLQIIPNAMFEKMARVIEIQTCILKELPTKLEKDKIKEYAQLNERFEFAELTHSISVFSQGMRMMKTTLVGVVYLDPKMLLEDGIRKELVQHISKALHCELIFSAKMKPDELEQRLRSLGNIMDGYKRSFEYIQDYVNINGLKIWQEEVTRIINYNVERECNGFLRNKVHDWESSFQSRYVPIPHYAPTDSVSENFIGRLAREILRITDPKSTIYIAQTSTWYDIKSQKMIANKQLISLIASGIEVTGLVGLDRLFSFMIITNLKNILGILENKDKRNASWHNILTLISSEIKSTNTLSNPSKFYQNSISRSSKLFGPLLDHILAVGQLQILRKLIAFHLNTRSKFDAKYLESSLNSMNKALLIEMSNPNESKISEELLLKLSQYFDYSGLNNPFYKVYVTGKCNEEYAMNLFVFTISYLPRMFLYGCSNVLKRNFEFDGAIFVNGLHTLLKQFHTDLNKKFIYHLCQYVLQLTKQAIT
ncbi:PREDICTED: WASH complex subunit strumpellin isoform X2 [Nicrophorus vespilloides]|nr:PREDICTED: WASH complex subunit strumpellin isoform X2 [Nicrophorus vespilloides]